MKYFRAVAGRVVQRFGTRDYLAARLEFGPSPKAGVRGKALGFRQDLTRVVKVTDAEYRTFRREYLNTVRRGDLVEATEKDFLEWEASLVAPQQSAGGPPKKGNKPAQKKGNEPDPKADE